MCRGKDHDNHVEYAALAPKQFQQPPRDKEHHQQSGERPSDVYARANGKCGNGSSEKSADKKIAECIQQLPPDHAKEHEKHDEYATCPFSLSHVENHEQGCQDGKAESESGSQKFIYPPAESGAIHFPWQCIL